MNYQLERNIYPSTTTSTTTNLITSSTKAGLTINIKFGLDARLSGRRNNMEK